MDILDVIERVNKSFSDVQDDMEGAYKRIKRLEKGQKRVAKSCFLNAFSVGILSYVVANLVAKMKKTEEILEKLENEPSKSVEV